MTQLAPEKLLGEILRFRPHTREGQFAAAEHVADIVNRHNLGVAEILEYPEWPDGSGEKFPLIKIMSEFGVASQDRKRSLITLLGHLDTVEPLQQQLQRDPLVLRSKNIGESTVTIGEGRGTLDMWSGNIAYLMALEILREKGNARHAIQTVLSSCEEAGSGVLHQAIQNGDLAAAPIGATTEILVGDSGISAPLYRGRTGRIGIDAYFRGLAPHAGAVDRDTSIIAHIAHRYLGRAIDELLDEDRGFALPNAYPGDTQKLLPQTSHAIPDSIYGQSKGLSVPGEILQRLNIFYSDPNLAAERVRIVLEEYFLRLHIPRESLELKIEERRGVPFIEPWLTPADHPLVVVAQKYARELRGEEVPVVAASGVAEEGMLFHGLGTQFIGWAPVGHGAHDIEHVEMDSIEQRALWAAEIANHDGDLS